jgi:hypothetical protein
MSLTTGTRLQFDKLCLPLTGLAADTGWQSCEQLDIDQTVNLTDIKIETDQKVFKKERLYGVAAVLAINDKAEYYLILIPQLRSPALFYFVKKGKEITGAINKTIQRNGGISRYFKCQGRMQLQDTLYSVFLDNISIQLHEHVFNGAKQTHDLKALWDAIVTGDSPVAHSSKIKDARKRKSCSLALGNPFDEMDNPFMKRKQEIEKKNQSHVLPKDVTNLFYSEELKSKDNVPLRNTLKSKDSGGKNSIVALVPNSKDECAPYLSDYHLATQVPDVYSIPHNQQTVLRARDEIAKLLINNGHAEGSPTFVKAIGAVSDKYFEGIEHRMTPEQNCDAKITEMSIDIDQVCLLLYLASIILCYLYVQVVLRVFRYKLKQLVSNEEIDQFLLTMYKALLKTVLLYCTSQTFFNLLLSTCRSYSMNT